MNGEYIAIFGAGAFGREAFEKLHKDGKDIICFIDNNPEIQGTIINDTEVLSLDDFLKRDIECEIIVACGVLYQLEIEKQLLQKQIKNYTFYNRNAISQKERLVSYCTSTELEDVILYHVLRDENDIFYIDVGSNDPFAGSVTKLLYDMKHARGINVEPQTDMYEITCRERPEDININMGLGAADGTIEFYTQGGCSTFVKDNVLSEHFPVTEIQVTTLKDVCDKHLTRQKTITFLKIDVEGFEKEVLQGADFETYRPWIIIMESTIPNTNIPNYLEWEDILLRNSYHFVYQRGVNRYYIANERENLEGRFLDADCIEDYYNIWYAKIEM